MAKSVVEYLKDFWGSITSSKKDENDGNKAIDDIIRQLSNSENDKKPVLPDAPSYDRIDYKPPTDDELKSSAEGELAEYKNSSQNAIDNEIANLEKKFDADKKSTESAYKTGDEAVESAYGVAKQNNDSDMLKRGLARSSVAANTSSEIEGEKAKQKTTLASAYAQEVSRIDAEINGLETKRTKALDDFNISYATKLTKSINELKSSREDKVKEALKYNNTITEKEHGDKVDKVMKESDLYTERLNQQGKGGNAATEKQLKLYNETAAALRAMDTYTARQIVTNNASLSNSLTPRLFYSLYDEFAR